MKQETEFIIKVIRNGFILSVLYFVSQWAYGDISWSLVKPILIFYITYIFTEFKTFFKVDDTRAKNKKMMTLFY